MKRTAFDFDRRALLPGPLIQETRGSLSTRRGTIFIALFARYAR